MLGVTMSGVVAQNAELGQNGLLAAALVLGIVFLWGPRPLMAGALLGVLAFKPQYAFPILLIAMFQRQWRVVGVGGNCKFPICGNRKPHTLVVGGLCPAFHDVGESNSAGAGGKCTDGRRGCC